MARPGQQRLPKNRRPEVPHLRRGIVHDGSDRDWRHAASAGEVALLRDWSRFSCHATTSWPRSTPTQRAGPAELAASPSRPATRETLAAATTHWTARFGHRRTGPESAVHRRVLLASDSAASWTADAVAGDLVELLPWESTVRIRTGGGKHEYDSLIWPHCDSFKWPHLLA